MPGAAPSAALTNLSFRSLSVISIPPERATTAVMPLGLGLNGSRQTARMVRFWNLQAL
jgi:hypothetical protein